MTKHLVFRLSTLFFVASTAAGMAQAACLPDQPEIGDIGPDGECVCTLLQHSFPDTDIRISNREIQSPTSVVITATVDADSIEIEYHLMGYTWGNFPAVAMKAN